MARTSRDIAQEITDTFIASLEKGYVPWHKPWSASGGAMPRSLSTGKPYRGTNSMLLGISSFEKGYASPWWGTYDQITKLGGQVKKGEHGTSVILYKTIERDDENSEGETDEKKKQGAILRSFTVFNASQCTGLPEMYMQVEEDTRPEHERIEACEEVVAKYLANGGPSFGHDGGDRAFYSPSQDRIAIPTLASFDSPEEYYSTLFHELTHSTGHSTRLNREGIVEGHRFGDQLYSKEELIAETGAAMACAVTGIDQTTTIANSEAYIKNWLSQLRDPDNKSLILKASAAAQRAMDHMGVFDIDYELTHSQEEVIDESVTNTPEVEWITPTPSGSGFKVAVDVETEPVVSLDALEADVKHLKKALELGKDPVRLAENDLLDAMCRDRALLAQTPVAERASINEQLGEHQGKYSALTEQVKNPLLRAMVIRESQAAHANDEQKFTEAVARLATRQEELRQYAYSEPHPWVAEMEGSNEREFLRVAEYRQKWNIHDENSALGEEILDDEQARERAQLSTRFFEPSLDYVGGMVR